MATIDTTLDFFKIPGIDTFTHLFGTKKTSGKGLTTEEVANNIAAGFMRQRPFVVTETSNTQRIDANSLFLITANEPAAPIVLTLGEAAFIGCEISVINKSDVEHSLNATYSGSTLGTVTLPAKSKMSLIWTGDGWIILDSQKINNNEFSSALSAKDLPAIEAMNFGENSGYIKWTNGLLMQWARTTIKRLDAGQFHEAVLSMPLTTRKIVSVQHDVYISNRRGGLAPIYQPRLNYADMRTFTMMIYNGNSDPSNWAEDIVINICVYSFD